jgi:integral membrane protein
VAEVAEGTAVTAGDARVRRALARYRVIAWIVGVLLIVLFCVGIPLQFAAGHRGVDRVVGIAHGMVFYPLYLIATLDLGWRARMRPIRLLLTLVAGTVPFLSFVAERETRRWVASSPVPAGSGVVEGD